MLSRISYTTRAYFVALMLCTASDIKPQDEQPLRDRRCKCVHLGQWLQSIVARAHGVVHAPQSLEPSIPPIAEAKRRLIVSSSHSPKKKSDTTPSSRFARKRGNMSPEEELIWAYAYDSNFDNLVAALARNPDPFSDTVFTNAQLTNFLPHNIISYRTNTLEEYVDQYLTKHINKLAQPASTTAQEALLSFTLLPEALINIICNYTGQYQLPPNVMQYLGARIEQNIPITGQQVLSLLPYCTDEKGKSLFYYVEYTNQNFSSLISYGVDFFNTRPDKARYMLHVRCHTGVGKEMIKMHVNNLQKDPILFASPIESDIFFKTISDALNKPASYSNGFRIYEVGQGENKIVEVGHDFEQSDQYTLIQDYITVAPSLLAMHNEEGRSIFDHVDAACDEKSRHIRKVNALLRLMLEHKADPNMQNKDGNTFLHRLVLDECYFTPSLFPNNPTFIPQCAPQLDLTIANNDRQTVFDILESRIKYCDKQQRHRTRQSYQKFMDKLAAIKASRQATLQPAGLPCVAHSAYPGEHKDFSQSQESIKIELF